MNRESLLFSANQQKLVCESGVLRLAEGTVNYIDATFELGENWTGFDSVRAVWINGAEVRARVLDLYGHCIVPHEVLAERGTVKVNLVGSVIEDNILVDRLTSEQRMAIVVSKVALYEEKDSEPISPTQFEQFVAEVKEYRIVAGESASAAALSEQNAATSEVNAKESEQNAKASELAAKESELNAAESAVSAAADAERAETASATAGYMFFDIDDYGYLQYTRTANTEVDFYLDNGDLFVTDEEVNNGN